MIIVIIIIIIIVSTTVSKLTLFKAPLTENAQQIPAQVDQWWSLWYTSCNKKIK